jgi:hypothetical protein
MANETEAFVMVTSAQYRDSLGFKVVTETGVQIGWVKRVVDDDDVKMLAISHVPLHWIPDFVTGIYHLSIDEIAEIDDRRIIVFEGTEENLINATIGWFDRFNWTKPSWKKSAKSSSIIVPHSLPNDISNRNDWDEDDGAATSSRNPNPKGPSPLNHQADIPY